MVTIAAVPGTSSNPCDVHSTRRGDDVIDCIRNGTEVGLRSTANISSFDSFDAVNASGAPGDTGQLGTDVDDGLTLTTAKSTTATRWSRDPIPYDPMLGWYTAATLSGLLLVFLACVGLERIKQEAVDALERR